MLKLFEKDNNQTVSLHLGEMAEILLAENATTGFRWAVDFCDGEFLDIITTESEYGKAVGSGGEAGFIIQGKKIGTGEIRFKYLRSWEGDSSVVNRFRIIFNIAP